MVGFPEVMSWPTSWKILLQLMDLSREPLFTMTATASNTCSLTYFWRLLHTPGGEGRERERDKAQGSRGCREREEERPRGKERKEKEMERMRW